MNTTLYGIKNCDTEARGVAYNFHDYKKDGVPTDKLKAWSKPRRTAS